MLHDLSSVIAKALAEGKTPIEAARIGASMRPGQYCPG